MKNYYPQLSLSCFFLHSFNSLQIMIIISVQIVIFKSENTELRLPNFFIVQLTTHFKYVLKISNVSPVQDTY
jgi:hypothetical protein